MILENSCLRADVRAEAGATIASLRHLASGVEMLAQLPWDPVAAPTHAAPDELSWLARWTGGWPPLFPNGGDAGLHAGVHHGFHGEASVATWTATRDGKALVLARRFLTVPARMTRRLTLDGPCLTLDAEVEADAPCEVIWGEHVTLGGALLDGPVTLATSATRAVASADYAPPESPLVPGAESPWPCLPGRTGTVDLSHPQSGWSLLAGLFELGPAPFVEVTREGGPTVRIEWTADPWPLAWLWIETGGDRNVPWFGRGRALGVEPSTTWPPTGLARATRAGGRLLQLRPGEPGRARLSLLVT